MSTVAIVTYVCIAINLGVVAYNVTNYLRRTRELDREQRLVELEFERVRELDALLAHLCVQAVNVQSSPAWRAWAQTMGNITVEIHAQRQPPEDTP